MPGNGLSRAAVRPAKAASAPMGLVIGASARSAAVKPASTVVMDPILVRLPSGRGGCRGGEAGAAGVRNAVPYPPHRAPKTALPRRTMVAPSAMAHAMSRLMPIDNSNDAAPTPVRAAASSRMERRRA